MENSIIILFYSKYSSNSLELIRQMETFLTFKKICVDNKDIRHTILNESEKYNIQEVPCIFVFFVNGTIHKYEGIKATEWVREIQHSFQNPHVQFKPSFQELQSVEDISASVSVPENIITKETQEAIDTEANRTDPYLDMKRKFDTVPLNDHSQTTSTSTTTSSTIGIDSSSPESFQMTDMTRMDSIEQYRMKMVDKNKKTTNENNSILNIAQSLQAQREREDESMNPSAISKMTLLSSS